MNEVLQEKNLLYSIGFLLRWAWSSVWRNLSLNESLETINQMLDKANNFHPNIKLVRQIGTNISFLDVSIENNNSTLATSVFHKQVAEPYVVPFKSDHPRHVFKNVIDGALMRAVRYSSTLSAFHKDRRSIKLMLLYNDYFLLFTFNFQHIFCYF